MRCVGRRGSLSCIGRDPRDVGRRPDATQPSPAPYPRRDGGRPMKVLLVQPSRLQPDGSVYKGRTRWLLGMTLPYLAALTPPGIAVEIVDDLYEDVPLGRPYDLVGLTCMS